MAPSKPVSWKLNWNRMTHEVTTQYAALRRCSRRRVWARRKDAAEAGELRPALDSISLMASRLWMCILCTLTWCVQKSIETHLRSQRAQSGEDKTYALWSSWQTHDGKGDIWTLTCRVHYGSNCRGSRPAAKPRLNLGFTEPGGSSGNWDRRKGCLGFGLPWV